MSDKESSILKKYGIGDEPSGDEENILKKYGIADSTKESVIQNRQRSSYDGVDPETLNFVQKMEKGAGDWGLIKPGAELFSPGAMEKKEEAAPVVAGAGLLAAGAMNPATMSAARMALPIVKQYAPSFTKGAGAAWALKKMGLLGK